MVSIKKNP